MGFWSHKDDFAEARALAVQRALTLGPRPLAPPPAADPVAGEHEAVGAPPVLPLDAAPAAEGHTDPTTSSDERRVAPAPLSPQPAASPPAADSPAGERGPAAAPPAPTVDAAPAAEEPAEDAHPTTSSDEWRVAPAPLVSPAPMRPALTLVPPSRPEPARETAAAARSGTAPEAPDALGAFRAALRHALDEQADSTRRVAELEREIVEQRARRDAAGALVLSLQQYLSEDGAARVA